MEVQEDSGEGGEARRRGLGGKHSVCGLDQAVDAAHPGRSGRFVQVG